VQASVSINWGGLTNANDLGLKVFGADGSLRGESNRLNLPGLTGKREKVTIKRPRNENWNIAVRNTLGVGTAQDFFGTVSATQVRYLEFKDLQGLAGSDQTAVYDSVGSYLVLSDSNKFRPFWSVTRSEFAEALVRSGRVPQYVAAKQMFADVRDLTTRAAVESVQSNPSGKLIIDASNGLFRPSDATTRLVAAVALIKAAGLENNAASAVLPTNVKDSLLIPASLRGYVAIALQNGFLSLDENNKFNPNSDLSRLCLSKALIAITSRAN
jgi:hypothetical protein